MSDEKVGKLSDVIKDMKEGKSELDKSAVEIEELMGKNASTITDITGRIYKFSPIAISQYPKFHKLMERFQDQENVISALMTGGDDAAEVIMMGIGKNHPEVTLEFIKDNFDFAAYPRAIKLAINLSHFFVELREIKEIMAQG